MNSIPNNLSFTPCNLCQYHHYDQIKCYIKNIIVNLERGQSVAFLYSTLDPDHHFPDLIFLNWHNSFSRKTNQVLIPLIVNYHHQLLTTRTSYKMSHAFRFVVPLPRFHNQRILQIIVISFETNSSADKLMLFRFQIKE